MSDTPQNLKFTSTHEWINSERGDMIVGITDHAQQLLGDMVFVDLPAIGTEVTAGDEIGVVESVKAASDFYAPISGVIVAVNTEVNENPALVNSDPYGAGWLVKINATSLEEINDLLLRGKDGVKLDQVDARGRGANLETLSFLSQIKDVEPVSGENLVLTLDADVQQAAFDSFKTNERIGALVAAQWAGYRPGRNPDRGDRHHL